MPHMDIETLTEWDNATIVFAWKLTDQEMKDRKLDTATFAARREVRHATNTENIIGLTVEQCKQPNVFNTHFGSQAWYVSACARVWAHGDELLANAPRPAPPNFTSSSPLQEETWELADGTVRFFKNIVTFDADAQEIVVRWIAIHVGEMYLKRSLAELAKRQEEQEAQAAGEAKRRLQELSTMGMCKWDRVIQLREEEVIARSITRAPAGMPRHTCYDRNALNTEAILGISKEDLEDRGDFEAGPSPGVKLIEAKMTHDPAIISYWL